jgi:hypothetical protein
LFEGAILAGLLFALPFIVDKVIPFVQDTLIPFIKGPFSDFARVLGGFVKEGFDTVWPYVGQAFSAIGGWLSNNSEKIWSAVGKTFSVIGSVLSIVGPFVWGAVEGVFTAMGNWWDANGTGVLVAIKGIFTSIGNWVSENKEGIWNSISGAISSFGDFITEIFWPFLKEVGAPLFISNLMNVFGAVGDLFRLLSGDLSVGSFLDSLATRWLNTVNNSLAGLGVVASGVLGGGFVKDNFLLSGATELAQGYAIVGRNNAGVNLGSSFYLDRSTGEMYRVPAKESTVLEGEGVVKGIGPHDSRGWGEVVDSSKLPSSATMVGVVEALRPEETWENFGIPYVRSEENSLGPEPQPQKIDDGVITSDGKVIQTSPEDNIYAFKGDVSIAPANSMREFSGSPVSYNNSQTHSTSNVTNNYISQSNFNLADLFPASEFDPVGV